MPDNVARIIAGASATFTASSMAISYATYRRVRPRLKVRAYFTIEVPHHLKVRVRNHGQTAVKVTKVAVQFREILYKDLYKRLRMRLPIGEYSYTYKHTWYPRLQEGAAMDIAAFGGAQWDVKLSDKNLWILAKSRRYLRVSLELPSGAVVYNRWRRKPGWLEDYAECEAPTGGQSQEP
ncbi:hypothetical protein [Streptomyces sp. NPDC001530]|uniref:hypothetical protein n=1 Tax=Streptomyces sp. NPDC001530 TaxID=3364582 RepID=UPI0036C26CF2